MALQYLFDPNKQFQSRNGVNAVNGFLRVYLNGTDDRATTYRNFDGGLNEPDIVFDTDGRAMVIVDDTKIYRLEVYSQTGALQWTVENYKAQGGSGGGYGTPVSVDGTAGEIDVDENEVGGVKHFVVSLAENVKNAISSLTSAVNGLALSLGNKKERQTPKEFIGSTTKTVVGVSQNEDGEMSVSFGDIPLDNYELDENKKTTVTSYEGSNTYYPTIKAVVDFVNGMMQNLGGKLITDNGDPFTDSASLPTTTPFQGIDIADKDYAYIQDVGTAERWSATVSGSIVTWQQEYAISIPVFTPAQQAAIDSGANATKIGNYDSHISNTAIHVTTTEKNTWNAKQNALPTTGTPSNTFAINVSGSANKANYLLRAYVNKSSQTTKIWKKIATSQIFTNYNSASICFLYNHSGYTNELGLDSIVSVSIHTAEAGSLVAAPIYTYSYRSASETQIVRIGNTNQYEVWVKVPTTDTNMFATILNSYGSWTINTDDSQTGQLTDDEFTAYKSSNPSIGTIYNYNIAKASKAGVGSTRLPIFANANGILSPMNIDEYYCWAQPTTQWTDVMKMDVYGVQNQCNNECLGSVKRINLNSTHPSLCYLNVRLPDLQGAGRYRFTLEFEITNSDGQNGTNAYGVLILVPPTGYSGESFLAECVYDSSGIAQSSVMNQIHVPPQGHTYRHKLYVDGHTYRVVKTK